MGLGLSSVDVKPFLNSGASTIVISCSNEDRQLYLMYVSKISKKIFGQDEIRVKPITDRNAECFTDSLDIAKYGRLVFVEEGKSRELGKKLLLGVHEGQKDNLKNLKSPKLVLDCDVPLKIGDLGAYEYRSESECNFMLEIYANFLECCRNGQ